MEQARQSQRNGGNGYRQGNKKKEADPYRYTPMELDATKFEEGYKGNRENRNSEKKEKRRCFNCNKVGHLARNCRLPKKNQDKEKKQQQELRATRFIKSHYMNTEQHSQMSWIACDNDDCLIHLSEKEATGYFPRGIKRIDQLALEQLEQIEYNEWNRTCECTECLQGNSDGAQNL